MTSLNSVSVVTKYTPPCCGAHYVWYVKQNNLSKYSSKKAQLMDLHRLLYIWVEPIQFSSWSYKRWLKLQPFWIYVVIYCILFHLHSLGAHSFGISDGQLLTGTQWNAGGSRVARRRPKSAGLESLGVLWVHLIR